MLTKIISGGQTGADQGALSVAVRLGLKTGGYAPLRYMTEDGPDPTLARYGLEECRNKEYPPRTLLNVVHSDGTVWFGYISTSRGYRLTKRLCERRGKPFLVNPDAKQLRDWADRLCIETLNVAGNRASKNAHVRQTVIDTIFEAFKSED